MTSPAVRIQPLRGRAILAVLTLGLCALDGLSAAVLPLFRPGFALEGRFVLILWAVTGLAFVSWLFDARINLEDVEPRLRWHPIWTCSSWLMPFANLVIPLLVVHEIDRATQRLATGSDRSGLFAVWATAWMTFLFSRFVGGVVAGVIEVVAAVAAVLLVLRITAQQEIAGSPYLVATVKPRPLGGTGR